MEDLEETIDRVNSIWHNAEDKDPIFQSFGFKGYEEFIDWITELTAHFKAEHFKIYVEKILEANQRDNTQMSSAEVMASAMIMAESDMSCLMMMLGREREKLERAESKI